MQMWLMCGCLNLKMLSQHFHFYHFYAGIAYLFANTVLEKLGIGRTGIGLAIGVVLIGMGVYFLFVFKPKFTPGTADVKASGIRKGVCSVWPIHNCCCSGAAWCSPSMRTG